jgi:tight adherence protein B
MILVLSVMLILISIANIWILRRRRGRLQVFYNLEAKNKSLSSLVEEQLRTQKLSFWERLGFDFNALFGSYYNLLIVGQSKARLLIYIFAGVVAGIVMNQKFFNYANYIVVPSSAIVTVFIILFLKKRKLKKEFYETFPEALNIITGVVSSGNAITTSFKVCGNAVDGIVGKTMKEIDRRIEIGESAEGVLLNSYQRLPFPEYYFFILTIMVNLDGGGELKEVLNRLTKMLSNNRILAKTRDGKTAELRMSMIILGFMPFGFILLLKFVSEENYGYLVGTTVGHYILYYIVGSVVIGYSIIKGMINKII